MLRCALPQNAQLYPASYSSYPHSDVVQAVEVRQLAEEHAVQAGAADRRAAAAEAEAQRFEDQGKFADAAAAALQADRYCRCPPSGCVTQLSENYSKASKDGCS